MPTRNATAAEIQQLIDLQLEGSIYLEAPPGLFFGYQVPPGRWVPSELIHTTNELPWSLERAQVWATDPEGHEGAHSGYWLYTLPLRPSEDPKYPNGFVPDVVKALQKGGDPNKLYDDVTLHLWNNDGIATLAHNSKPADWELFLFERANPGPNNPNNDKVVLRHIYSRVGQGRPYYVRHDSQHWVCDGWMHTNDPNLPDNATEFTVKRPV